MKTQKIIIMMSCPEWVRFITHDRNGHIIWWENKPHVDKNLGIWVDNSDGRRMTGESFPTILEVEQDEEKLSLSEGDNHGILY